MKIITKSISFVLIGIFILNSSSFAKKVENVSIITDNIVRNESVLPYDNGIFASNFGNGAGYILYIKDGVSKKVITNGISTPTGMAIKDDLLYVCDGNKIKVYSIKNNYLKVTDLNLPHASDFANDCDIHSDFIYVSVTGNDKIIRANINSIKNNLQRRDFEDFAKVPGPNGIVFSEDNLYVASIPKDYVSITSDEVIYKISNLENPVVEKFLDKPGLNDGIALSDDKKTLYYSDWKDEAVYEVDIATKNVKELYKEKGLSPADISQKYGIIYIPDLNNNRILAIDTKGQKSMNNTKDVWKISN